MKNGAKSFHIGRYKDAVEAARLDKKSQWMHLSDKPEGVYLMLSNYNKPLALVRRDNVIEFMAPRWVLHSLQSTLASFRKYTDLHLNVAPMSCDIHGTVVKGKEDSILDLRTPEIPYYPGLKINLLSGEEIDPPTFRVAPVIDPRSRYQFSIAFKQWVDMLATRLKLGVFSAVKFDSASSPCWDSARVLDTIVHSIKDNKCPVEVMEWLLCGMAEARSGGVMTTDETKLIEFVVHPLFTPLSIMHGVYGDEARDSYISTLIGQLYLKGEKS